VRGLFCWLLARGPAKGGGSFRDRSARIRLGSAENVAAEYGRVGALDGRNERFPPGVDVAAAIAAGDERMQHSYEDFRRARIAYALGLVVISAGLGFLGGRFSALLVPVASHSLETALGRVAPEAPRDDNQSQQQVAKREPPETAGHHHKDSSANSQSSLEQPGLIGGAPEPSEGGAREARNVPSEPEQADNDVVLGATVINSGSALPDTKSERNRAGTRREQSDAENARDDAGSTECARRYASFRESDGTYQPYNSPQRRPCPLLR
jgi:hypothetical protein